MDQAINTFFVSLGGINFLALMAGILIVLGIIFALIRPIDN